MKQLKLGADHRGTLSMASIRDHLWIETPDRTYGIALTADNHLEIWVRHQLATVELQYAAVAHHDERREHVSLVFPCDERHGRVSLITVL